MFEAQPALFLPSLLSVLKAPLQVVAKKAGLLSPQLPTDQRFSSPATPSKEANFLVCAAEQLGDPFAHPAPREVAKDPWKQSPS